MGAVVVVMETRAPNGWLRPVSTGRLHTSNLSAAHRSRVAEPLVIVQPKRLVERDRAGENIENCRRRSTWDAAWSRRRRSR